MWIVELSWIEEADFGSPVSILDSGNRVDIMDKRLTERFRMYDDDGNLYYEGKSDDNSSFEPLDDFGMPNAGCTEIRYYNSDTEEWEAL